MQILYVIKHYLIKMKKIIIIFIILFTMSCSTDYSDYKQNTIIIKKDTIIYKDTFELFVYKEIVNKQTDSINKIIKENDSLKTKLFISDYKLNRIKYYNDIAAKNNNIKYLRGWINRVLNK